MRSTPPGMNPATGSPSAPPPAGGFGSPSPEPPQVPLHLPHGYGPAPKTGSTGTIIAVVAGAVGIFVVAAVGVLAVLGIYGTRKYIANAKTAEARNSLGIMAKDAAAAYETAREADGTRALCPSARTPVPTSLKDVSAKKYLSSPSDWSGDPGFACLGFALSSPQYYQYNYTSTGTGFTGAARGDLDGDGIASMFEIKGRVQGDNLTIAPAIEETDPGE